MTKIFICDNCGDQFSSPLDEEKYTDDNGVSHTLDLCAPCRKKLSDIRKDSDKKFLSKLVKK